MGFFQRLKEGLKKTSDSIVSVFSKTVEIDEDFYDELEETLISADMGFETTERVIEELREKVEELGLKSADECKKFVMESLRNQMLVPDNAYCFEDAKTVMLIIGVNGVGKTTSIGKLAAQYKNQGRSVLVAAADTFRAGAIEQLRTWTERAGVDIIAQGEGADPSAVVFDAVKAAKARKTNITLIDTAGRLHNKKNLMDELAKMRRVIAREYPECYVETLIVLDGSTGQNALEQARQETKQKVYRSKEQRALDAKKRARIKELEGLIEAAEERIPLLEAELTDQEITKDYEKLNAKCAELEQAKKELDDCMEEWAVLSDELQ